MEIRKTQDGTKLTMALTGRLDTTTAPELESAWREAADGVTELTIDMKALEYISSAGLRVLLSMQKVMNQQGSMVVRNANEAVREVFEITGFADILTLA